MRYTISEGIEKLTFACNKNTRTIVNLGSLKMTDGGGVLDKIGKLT
jgi:hypothetical protein